MMNRIHTCRLRAADKEALKTAMARSAIAITLLAALAACQPKVETPMADDGPKVSGDAIIFPASGSALRRIATAKVEAPHERELSVPGRLVWDEDRTVRVFTPFAGRVSRVIANVGDRVVVGQVLAELQSPDFAVAQSDARKAQSSLALTTKSLARVKELAASGVAAGKDLQQAEADYANAEAEANRAEARLKLYGNTRNVDQRFPLVSPITGTVVERNLNPGQELRPDQPGAPQFVVTDPSKLWVQLDAAEADLGPLKPGTPIIVMSNQYPDDTFAGELKQIADYIDPVSRTLKLRGNVPNADRRLKAELFVTARIAMPKSNYPTVPEKAVFLDGIRRFVFIKTGERQFERRGVKVRLESNGMMSVMGGLKEGEEVVVNGNLLLQQVMVSERAGGPTDKAKPGAQAPENAKGAEGAAKVPPKAPSGKP